jgi:hypothetical protein
MDAFGPPEVVCARAAAKDVRQRECACVICDPMKSGSQGAGRRFAQVYGSPGARTRFTGLIRAAWPFFLAAAGTGYLLRAAVPAPALGRALAGGLLLFLGAALLASVAWLRPRLESFIKGARGEEWVARELAFLPSAYQVFHGLLPSEAVGSRREADCDHVVIGPTGLFVIETKNWSGKITVENGRILYDGNVPHRPPLDQVKEAASGLRQHLKNALEIELDVAPIVCFAANTLEGTTQGVGGVIVCNARYLNAVIEDSAERPLENARIEQIGQLLRGLCE